MSITAKKVESIDEADVAGAYQFIDSPDGGKAGLALRCPGCRQASFLPFTDNFHEQEWDLLNEDPIEVTPSIHHATKDGGCGWHGWLRNGVFERE